jgi:acyl-CoA synthetase (AMP-forming)/AMP-acid ligase II
MAYNIAEPAPAGAAGGGELTLDEIGGHCRTHLAGYKVPRQLTLVEAISRSPSGKPDYPWAQRVARAGAAASGPLRASAP